MRWPMAATILCSVGTECVDLERVASPLGVGPLRPGGVRLRDDFARNVAIME